MRRGASGDEEALEAGGARLQGPEVGREASGARRRAWVGLVLNTRGIWEEMDLDREEIPMWERSGGGEGQAS